MIAARRVSTACRSSGGRSARGDRAGSWLRALTYYVLGVPALPPLTIPPAPLPPPQFASAAAALAPTDVVIVGAARTGLGSFGGQFASVPATALGAAAARGALAAGRVPAGAVTDVILGNVLSAGLGQAPARQASKGAGVPDSACNTTVNKVCSSGLKAAMYAAQALSLGHAGVVLAGGFESMSRAPYYAPAARFGARYGDAALVDGLAHDGLWDPYNACAMGACGEKTAAEMGITREEQDAFARASVERARAATESGAFAAEIAPVGVKGKGGAEAPVTVDEQWRKADFGKMATLKPAFKPAGGTITAANASPLSDGAAAVVLTTAARAAALGLTPLARVRAYADAEGAPVDFPTAPAAAVKAALARAGMAGGDVDFHEINEAFAAVAIANARLLGLDLARVNAHGGAVALGHPLGASGARILVTLLGVLRAKGGAVGCASICNGGGGASAMIVERLA